MRGIGAEVASMDARQWGQMTQEEIEKIYFARCAECKYRGMVGRTHCCDYLTITGHRRGCGVIGCKRFEPGKRSQLIVGCTVGSVETLKTRKETGYGRRMRPPKTYLGKALDDYMKAHDLNQITLADRIGVSKSVIGDWRRGTKKIKEESLEKIAATLGIQKEEVRDLFKKGMIAPEAGGAP
ncbi:MAG: helix-turn-helix transcriptional regulator [Lachnospiraceae bacterium]|nr:helix-turn-helix transcriptional regulator [Lachnospiraceae bacterium]